VIQPQIWLCTAAICMALRPIARLGLVGNQRLRDVEKQARDDDESDVRASLLQLANTLSARGGVSLSADLALDLLLNRIAQQARLATNTTGAAIALRRGDEIVCRATTGANAPDLGVRLNMSSGLSGACVQTREVQNCDDTETDLRVDSIACRQLGVRSILIVPVLKEQELLGVFEVFSPQPHAFGDRDVQTLHALSLRAIDSIASSAEAVSPRRPALSVEAVIGKARSRDPWTLPLTVLVVGLAVFLGWLMGRDGWQRTLRDLKAKSAAAKIYPQATPMINPPPSPTSAPAASTNRSAFPTTSSGGLVVYENGKVIYRARPQADSGASPGGNSQDRSAFAIPLAELPPQIAERYLLQRIEPAYPDAAREQHIQGQVLLHATVGKEGMVQELKVISGDPQLAAAAADAVRQWNFRPFLQAGKPVEFRTQITVDFRLP
jgi:TonB family protein